MTDNTQIAAALAAIAQVLQTLQNQHQPPPASTPVFAHYDFSTPFNLSQRAGSSAFDKACAPLSEKWDGTIDALPNFIIALHTRASECKWNAPEPHGILTYTTNGVAHNILTDYHSIDSATIETARAARTDPRAIQNAQAFYFCVKNSLEGAILETVYEQLANLPTHEDGATLFKTVTSLSMASSLQLTIQTVQNIQALDPATFDYQISRINTRLTHLFMLAASVNRQLSEPEKIQHTLTIYSKIRQPEAWAQWVRARIEDFDDNKLHLCQTLMNSATLKQLKIRSDSGEFHGRSTTIQEDVVAMMATKAKRTPFPSRPGSSTPSERPAPSKTPPFLRHFKTPDGTKYSVGDTKTFDGVPWYFCGCPKHRDNIKWHTHSVDTCRVRQKWLAEGHPVAPPPTATPPTALVGHTPDAAPPHPPTAPPDITALLAHALSAVGDNTMARALIADALNAVTDPS